ncbi:30S ribosomal protein S5 [Thermorudis peleae]|uniref:30S ribosomal protein S5 n=1 Tax=Thermorudis peleae TaxID=1382356 RepID=UPI0005701720|nr:30S ribosomal protein S5 [Thermorudis peleae]
MGKGRTKIWPFAQRVKPDQVGDLRERVIQINRVAKVVQGGRRFHFSSVVVVGDGEGHVGVGIGKATEVPDSIRKAVENAKKRLIRVPLDRRTIPHEIEVKFGATRVLMRPAAPGTGVIAGAGVRAVAEAAGIRDLIAKSHGSNNPVNVTQAALLALSMLESPEQVAARRGIPVERLRPRKRVQEESGDGCA